MEASDIQPSDAPRREVGTRSRSGNTMARTRAALLRATAQCVEHYGVRKTTMVDVASRSGVAKATLYNHFRTKRDVLTALVETTSVDLVAAAVTTAGTEGLVDALTGVARSLAMSGPLRKTAAKEPALLAPMLVPGEGRGWQAVREGIAQVLVAGGAPSGPRDVELVLRWLVSQLMWPLGDEQSKEGATALVRGLGGGAVPVRADLSGLGWPA